MSPGTAEVKTAARGARDLPPLPLVADLAAAWLELEAVAIDGQRAAWAPGDVARQVDDRRAPPLPPTIPAPWDELPPAVAEWASFEPQTRGQNPTCAEAQDVLPGASTGTPGTRPLGSRREVISTLDRYLLALQRVDDAYGVLEEQLQASIDALAGAWSAAGVQRCDAVRTRLEATRRRRESARRCMLGDQQLTRFLCQCCGSLQYGPPAGCNSRTCPRCVRKLRREQMGRIGRILDAVAERRQTAGQRLPRWRFLTLTAPSWSQFRPMRQFLASAWGRVLRSRVWTDAVGAAVVAWECTHTAAGWHVHLHGAIDAWVERRGLARAWQSAQLAEYAGAAARGEYLPGAPKRVADALDAVRAMPVARRRGIIAATTAATRAAAAWNLELAQVLYPDPNRELPEPPRERDHRLLGEDERERIRRKARRRWQDMCTAMLASSWLPTLRELLSGCSTPAGVSIKELATTAALVSELAKYMGKDLGGVQCEDTGEWGVAGTADRLAEFIGGTWRWRTLRTYGDAFDRDEAAGTLSCDSCGEDRMTFDGVSWVSAEVAARVEREQAERRQLRARQRFQRRDPAAQVQRLRQDRESFGAFVHAGGWDRQQAVT
jgi:hypothetical protein